MNEWMDGWMDGLDPYPRVSYYRNLGTRGMKGDSVTFCARTTCHISLHFVVVAADFHLPKYNGNQQQKEVEGWMLPKKKL